MKRHNEYMLFAEKYEISPGFMLKVKARIDKRVLGQVRRRAQQCFKKKIKNPWEKIRSTHVFSWKKFDEEAFAKLKRVKSKMN